MAKRKISNAKFKKLNKKSNSKGLNTKELLQVLDRMISDKSPTWKNKK